MNLKHLIKAVLDDNESLCLDSEEDKKYLANELYILVKRTRQAVIEAAIEKHLKSN